MSIRFWPFDSVGGDRDHDSLHPASALASVFEDAGGVRATPAMGDLEVSPTSPASMDVEVALGSAFVRGRFFEVYGDPEVVTIPASSSSSRVDRVVLRLDLNERRVELAVLQGTPGSSEPPALTRTSVVWELSLARVPVPGNASEVTTAEDERHDPALCGFAFPGGAVPHWGGEFTGPVSGPEPTEPEHFATKAAVDNATPRTGTARVFDFATDISGATFVKVVGATFNKPAGWNSYTIMASAGAVMHGQTSNATPRAEISIGGVVPDSRVTAVTIGTARVWLGPAGQRTGITAASVEVNLMVNDQEGTTRPRGGSLTYIATRES